MEANISAQHEDGDSAHSAGADDKLLAHETLPANSPANNDLNIPLAKLGHVRDVVKMGVETVVTVEFERGALRKFFREPAKVERYCRGAEGNWTMFPQSGVVPDETLSALREFWKAWKESGADRKKR